ncbi:hypothetical protein E2562_015717 [Oryza meyeriana var. granulata]|uniref:Ninja-family protein n=1 Tax=Oryza meyeriana var. granulata TaxID=110450 RepID=A0A6G1D3C7_9ORYZ|nr:hypothetical protein E2562_015717 [Oryza meyeriana var. granulata]
MASRDFLGGFGGEVGAAGEKAGSVAGGKSDEIELSLGLSLGGCFGADPAREFKKPRLVRSSSIASICSLPGGDDVAAAAPPPAPLMRTSSLPTETEEERWRRREMQSLKRLEAKRKRLERRNSMNSGRSGGGGGSRDDGPDAMYPTGFQLRRSVASQGSTSSCMPEQGVGAGAEAMDTSSSDNASCQNKPLPPTASSGGGGRPPNGSMKEQPPLRTLRSLTMRTTSTGDLRKSMMEDMPMVSSRVDGPNGRKIDGFLYKYRKGEEVRIVCVCHGNFLTPAEFVKHAGGGDVTNPLRHIVVNPSPSVFL